MTRVALLTAAFGDGHNQVAQALRQEFERRGVETAIFDFYRPENSTSAKMSERVYEWTTRYTPLVYGASYRLTAELGPDHLLWRILSARSAKKILQRLNAYAPQAILQLFPDHSLRSLPLSSTERPFIGAILTDFSVHGRWFHQNIDTYFLPHSSLVTEVAPFVSKRAEVVVSGIPLRSQFWEETHAVDVPHHPYVLVATGGRGLFPELEASVLELRRACPETHIYVFCGRNVMMRRSVRTLGSTDKYIHALPFQENVAAWFRGARFAIVKSGGVTVSECLASSCPMVIYKPQPGQEADNAQFVTHVGAAKIVREIDEFAKVLGELKELSTLRSMKSVCVSIGRAQAAEAVVNHVMTHM